MIIPSPLIRLDYNPAKDVLFVKWPDIATYSMPEVHHSLKDILDTIRFYDVKNLLIDSRGTVVAINKDDYAQISTDFKKELLKTRLKKVARLQSTNAVREEQVRLITQSKTLIAFQNFSDLNEAYKWLEA